MSARRRRLIAPSPDFALLSPYVPLPTDNLHPDRERIVSAVPLEDDSSFELKLRPQRLREFIGQNKVKDNLEVAIQAAKSRGEALDHVLLYGPPGLGKTTLANIIANEMGAAFQQTSGPTLQIKGDLTAILTNLRDKQVLFIDEVHRLQPALEELLYSALEDYKLDIIIGQGPSARTHTIEVRPFTFIGATTRAGLLSAPLRSRFGIVLRLEFYTHEDLKIILQRSAEILGVEIDEPGAIEIATRCRGTPRIANRLLRRVRDYAQVRGTGKIDKPTAQAALDHARSRPSRLRRDRPQAAAHHHREVPGRSGGREHAGSFAGRGTRRDRGNLRAVPDPDRLSRSHAARTGGNAAGLRPLRNQAAEEHEQRAGDVVLGTAFRCSPFSPERSRGTQKEGRIRRCGKTSPNPCRREGPQIPRLRSG